MLLAGSWVGTPNTSSVTDPETGQEIARVPVADVEHVELAVRAATAALGRAFPVHDRIDVLEEAADMLERRSEEAARLIATEGIKTIREARGEVARCVNTLRLSAWEASRLGSVPVTFDQTERGRPYFGFTTRVPVGVIAAITPFNDPMNLVAHKVGPALAGGNAVIVKPDSYTPLSALLLASILVEAGVPDGYLQVLTGPGSVVGAALAEHGGVRMVSFTGGVDTGRELAKRAGLKYLGMELGANNGVIVSADADLQAAAKACVDGAYAAAGQNCLHVQRIFIEQPAYDEFVEVFVHGAKGLRLGPKLDEDTDMGPLISESAAKRVAGLVEDATGRGALQLAGGPQTGVRWEPTALAGATDDSRLQTEEVYGPVTLLSSFKTVSDAIRRVNATDYGLHAAVFSRDIDAAFAIADRLDAGGVLINESTDFRVDSMPFGGRKSSGLGAEGVPYAVEAMTEPKLIAVKRQGLDSETSGDAD